MIAHLAPELVNGIVLGAFYAIIAIGLSLIMNLTGTINLAHGSFMTLAGYLAFALVSRGTNFWFALIASAIITGLLGVVIERLLISPLYKRSRRLLVFRARRKSAPFFSPPIGS